jgi:hypothetical protein
VFVCVLGRGTDEALLWPQGGRGGLGCLGLGELLAGATMQATNAEALQQANKQLQVCGCVLSS